MGPAGGLSKNWFRDGLNPAVFSTVYVAGVVEETVIV
jgi:hypothetical protein